MSLSRSQMRPTAEPEPIARIGRTARTGAEILGAALEFLWSRPSRQLTVKELMATIPTSRPAFYKYFDDIRGVMVEMWRDWRTR